MRVEQIRERLGEVERDLRQLVGLTARMDERLDDVSRTVNAIEREIGGTNPDPEHPSMRQRLHELEGAMRAGELAQEALRSAREMRSRSWNERRVWALFLLAALAALPSIDDAVRIVEGIFP